MTTPSAILPLHIDSTMLSAFRSCPQKFFNEFVLGLRPPAISVDLHAGAAFSGTLESFYKEFWLNDLTVPIAIGRAHAVFGRLWGDFQPIKDTPKTFDRMWAAFEDYIHTYPPRTDHIQPYFVGGRPTFEFSFAVPLDDPAFPRHPSGDPFVYVGRADLLGQYQGRPVIRDEKTSGRLDSNWAEKWDLRAQFLGYVWAARQAGLDINTVAVRGVIITKTMIRQVESIKVYSDHLLDLWYLQLQRDLWRLRRCWDDQFFDFNLGESCTQYGSCIFMPLCQSPTPENWYSNFEVRRWNPIQLNPVDPDQSSAAAKPASLGSTLSATKAPATEGPL